jgi:NAD(P)-dependent dehydrogenase (short-subunit alcohol dehydrogenase family)
MRKLAGRTAVVTGGASGLGAALARCFASEGMRVVVADIAAAGAAAVPLVREVAGTLAPTPEAMATPERAIRNLLAALRDERPYLVTHGPIPAAFEARIGALRAAIARADEEPA